MDGNTTQDPIMPSQPAPEMPLAPPPPVAPRSYAWVAWLVIAAMGLLNNLLPRNDLREEAAPQGTGKSMEMVMFELQAKYLVGAADFLRKASTAQDLRSQIETIRQGPIPQRLRLAPVVGELVGPKSAGKELQDLKGLIAKHDAALSEQEKSTLDALERLYRDYRRRQWSAPSLDDSERALLQKELGWFGRLALAPRQDAKNALRPKVIAEARATMWTLLGGVSLGCCGMAVGFLAFVAFATTVIAGQLHTRLGAGSPWGGIYAETFALWLALFIGLQIVAAIALPHTLALWGAGASFFASLVATAWPVVRGASWHRVRHEIGWTLGPRPWLEPLCGIAAYLASLPLMAAGLAVMLVLAAALSIFSGPNDMNPLAPTPVPGHPIVEMVAEGGLAVRVLMVILACVAAPLVEETMFRGVLYRHLRDTTARVRMAVSVAFSAALSGLVFAALHPQGLIAIPPLTALAFGFALMREWRGSLVAPMTAHALHNGILTTLLLFLI